MATAKPNPSEEAALPNPEPREVLPLQFLDSIYDIEFSNVDAFLYETLSMSIVIETIVIITF
ncbi:hypothetical protein B484DRAFT_402234 [Ochromonadaceae sp. CCMP2298]|nr:hypothetical protein B484DRAFT_402234 [Ochromonadaceae sp. CCMP2298]